MKTKQRHSRIETWDDERSLGNSLIVALKPGWRFEEIGEHVRGFDSVSEAMNEVRSSKPCDCSVCQRSPA
jgi:hypothetical protein